MSDRFEELLRSSAPEMPDPVEYRRLNRGVMREPVHLPNPATRRHRFLTAAASLVLMVFISGQTSELVSHDWALESEAGTTGVGDETVWHTDPVSGRTFNSRGTEAEVKGFQQAFAAQDGRLTKVSLLAYGGAACWVFHAEFNVNGKIKHSNLDNPSEYPCEATPDQVRFYRNYGRDLKLRKDLVPPDRIFVIHAFGRDIRMKEWTYHYPGFGEVTFATSERLDRN